MPTRRRVLAGLGIGLFAGCGSFSGEPADSWPLTVRNVTSEPLDVRVVVRAGPSELSGPVFGPETRRLNPDETWKVTERERPGVYSVGVETGGYYELEGEFEWVAEPGRGPFGIDIRRGRGGQVRLIASD